MLISTNPDITSLPYHNVSRVVGEIMEEWYTGVERRLWEMQYSFIRQLQRDQDEIKQMMNEADDSDKLQEELEMVRAENKELRKFFGKVPIRQTMSIKY